jgi:hypothetical protein
MENSIIPIPLLSYSPDLAPSDFWLFEHMKASPTEQQFPGPEDLRTGIHEFLSEIHRFELALIFHHWIERIQ